MSPLGRMRFGSFIAPFHEPTENPTLALERDLELVQWLEYLGFDEVWIGEHHTAGWETISSPEVFIAAAAERTRHITLGTGVIGLPYHHPFIVADRMVLLDHLTRGRVIMGVGPGSLPTDALMLGIDPAVQRRRMDEAMDVIMRLLTDLKPVTHESDWFTLREAVLQLRPYTDPHFPVAVAASRTPAGMVLAGKHGLGVLSPGAIPEGGTAADLKEFWAIAEETAAEHGKTMDRGQWRLGTVAHLADTKDDAIEQVRAKAGRWIRHYHEMTIGREPLDVPEDKIIDHMVDTGAWCIGTPDDMIALIERLQELSGGFGSFFVQDGEMASREQTMHSYELVARYVMPRFQGSLVGLEASQSWSAGKLSEIADARDRAVSRANRDYTPPGSRRGAGRQEPAGGL